ncbi:MAG: sterol desaturase family protein [Gammaproteobacteria bacterium]|jgi:sterol desaturase/sphingolipid hydroxylase (fatty acid hydroxylase superfamily)|nr:sterol desaturase family protein [Gammaproteobacteria bacterium]
MNEFLLHYEVPLRLGFFFGIFALMALWEIIAPRRARTVSKAIRWTSNIGIVFLNSVILRLVFPAAAVGMALFASREGWGVFNYIDAPYWIEILVSVVFLDFTTYLQHVMVHAVPVLWRLHRVHHADLDFDVTTGARFHPVEILLSMLIRFATITVLGPPVAAVVIFEVLLNATSLFNHANVRLPLALDRVLRLFVVTPDMHRVHHSVEDDETNSNFGFNLPWWDHMFGTYRDQPRAGHTGMTIGINTFRDTHRCNRLTGMLALPFIGEVTEYAINRRQWGGQNDP